MPGFKKKTIMGEDYHHPTWLLILGIVVVVKMSRRMINYERHIYTAEILLLIQFGQEISPEIRITAFVASDENSMWRQMMIPAFRHAPR